MVFKSSVIHGHHKRHEGTIFHITTLLSAIGCPQQAIQVDYTFGYNPRQPKSTEENIPYGRSNLTMEKKMVHKPPIPLIHAAPINHNDMPFPEIVHSKDFS